MEDKDKKKKKGNGIDTGIIGAVAGVTGTLGISGIAEGRKQDEEQETEATDNTQNTSNHSDQDITEDGIVDTENQIAENTSDADEIQPVDSGGSSTSTNNDFLTAELQSVNPDEIAQSIVIDADEADNLLASHTVEEIEDGDVEAIFNEVDGLTVDGEPLVDVDSIDETLLGENIEINSEEEENLEEEESEEDEPNEELADTDDMGDMIDDIS